MTPVRMIIAGLALGVISQAALAFQETQGSAGSTSAPNAAISSTEPAASSKGPEIRIPGLGSIGSLPKLDFGLELLYGAAPTAESRSPRDEKSDSDLQIRGTLKYRFPN